MIQCEQNAEDALLSSSAKASAQSATRLTDEQLEELEQVKEDCRTKTVGKRTLLESVTREFESKRERLEFLKKSNDALMQRKHDLVSERQSLEQRRNKMNQAIDTQEKEISKVQERIVHEKEENERKKLRRREVVRQLEESRKQMREFKDSRAETKRERKMVDCLNSMMRHFDGVKGRLIDLCQPRQRQYQTAVCSAMGRLMDAIVVDTAATGQECIKYMRDQRVGTATFLPLDTLKPKRINERHRNLGSRYTLAIDVLQYDEAIEKAVQYALSGAVVCETLEDARYLCFQKREKVKAVTLEGHIIAKNGDMTGGTSPGDQNQNNRFERKEYEKARRQRDNLERELNSIDRDLNPSRSKRSRDGQDTSVLQDLEMQQQNSRTKLKYVEMDLNNTTKKLDKCATELGSLKEALVKAEPEQRELEDLVSDKQQEVSEIEKDIAKIEEEQLAAFGKKHGLNDVRVFEQATLKVKQAQAEKLAKVKEQSSKLEAQLRYVNSRDLGAVVDKLEKRLSAERIKLKQKEAEAVALTTKIRELQEAVDNLELEHQRLKAAARDAKVEVVEITKLREEILQEKSTHVKRLTTLDNQIEKFRAMRHEVLRRAEMDQVELPRVGSKKRRRENTNLDDDSDEDDDMEVEDDSPHESSSGDPSSMGFSQADSKYVKRDAAETAKLDFSLLTSNLDADTEKKRDAVKKAYEKELHDLHEEIDSIQPNLRAEENFEDVSKRLKSTDDKLNKARVLSRKVELSFEEVKQRRYEKFIKMFEHVEQTIDRIYKDLTRSKRHPLGGNAYLSLNNMEEPWLGGIKVSLLNPVIVYLKLYSSSMPCRPPKGFGIWINSLAEKKQSLLSRYSLPFIATILHVSQA